MPEKHNDKTIFTLLEVANSVRKTLEERYKTSFWVKAEMNKLNHYRQSGHCYPELVEKRDGKLIAQMKSNLWCDDYATINSKFLRVLREPLKDGIKILFLATLTFDPNHGLALRILDIDPSFTLGDLEREKQESIQKLRDQGIFLRNKTLAMPLLPQRIAIISVETSKGYADFVQVIKTNPWNYAFFLFLFPAVLQGDNAVSAIIAQLERIKRVKAHFDVVAIIRGGGGDIGLSCYNNYQLARAIAVFPIPVITGIGHATNETVSELISFSNAITPTKLADYLLQRFHEFAQPVAQATETIIDKSKRLISEEKARLQSEIKLFNAVTGSLLITNRNHVGQAATAVIQHTQFLFRNELSSITGLQEQLSKEAAHFFGSAIQPIRQYALSIRNESVFQLRCNKVAVEQNNRDLRKAAVLLIQAVADRIDGVAGRMSATSAFQLRTSQAELVNIERNVRNMSPENVLKRGYSITLLNGKAIRESAVVTEGDTLETVVFEGNILSIVASTSQPGTHE